MTKEIELSGLKLVIEYDLSKIGAAKFQWLQKLYWLGYNTELTFENAKSKCVDILRASKRNENNALQISLENLLKTFFEVREFNFTYKGLAFVLLTLPNKATYSQDELEKLYLEYCDKGLTNSQINEVVDFFFSKLFESVENIFT